MSNSFADMMSQNFVEFSTDFFFISIQSTVVRKGVVDVILDPLEPRIIVEHASCDRDDLEESIFGSRNTFVHLFPDVRVWVIVHEFPDTPRVTSSLSNCLVHNVHQFLSFIWPFEVNLSSFNVECSSFVQISNFWHWECVLIPVVFAHSRLFLLLSLFFGHFLFWSIFILFRLFFFLLHFIIIIIIILVCEYRPHVLENFLDFLVAGVLTLKMIVLGATAVDAHREGFRKLVEIAKCVKKLIPT